MRTRLAALLVGIFGALVTPASASAHTALDFTLPTDGASVGEPVSEIRVGFTEPVTLVGPGFEVLDPQGNILTPFAVTDDDMLFRLQLDPPLGGGDVGVRYEVTSADGHVVSGSFSFTVSVPAPTTTVATTTTTTTTTIVAVTSTSAATVTTSPASTEPAPTTTTAVTPPPTTAPTTVAPDDGDDSSSTWILLAVAGLIVVGAGAFLVFRPKPPA